MAIDTQTAMKLFTFIALISLCNVVARKISYKGRRYAVVFDAGSTGTRVHVYSFGDNMELIPINGVGIEFAKRVKPGLSAYADNPEEAANSLKELLQSAVEVVPEAARPVTPVRLGATAGLRRISDVKADKILAAVRKLIPSTSAFKFKESWVSVLDGSQEGSYMWITANYLLSNLGKSYRNTVGIVDLGGASVQMAYAISEEQYKKVPKPNGDDTNISEINLYGTKYHLYVYRAERDQKYELDAPWSPRSQSASWASEPENISTANGRGRANEWTSESGLATSDLYKVNVPDSPIVDYLDGSLTMHTYSDTEDSSPAGSPVKSTQQRNKFTCFSSGSEFPNSVKTYGGESPTSSSSSSSLASTFFSKSRE